MRASSLFAESVFTTSAAAGRRRCPRLAAVPVPLFFSTGRGSPAMAEEAQQPRGVKVGGIHDAPAGRENDLTTVELARFAVAEHNSKAVRFKNTRPPFFFPLVNCVDRRVDCGKNIKYNKGMFSFHVKILQHVTSIF